MTATFTFSGNFGSWTDATKWTPSGGPPNNSLDFALIGVSQGLAYTVTLNASETIGGLGFAATTGHATLAMGANSLTITDAGGLSGTATISNSANITIAGGTLSATIGISVASGSSIKGAGTLTGAISGAGIIEATTGTLLLGGGAITATTLEVANAAAAILDLNNSSISGGTVTFVGTTAGTLLLGPNDFSGETLTGFSDTVAGLNVGSTTTPTNQIDLRGVTAGNITAASVSGTTLTVMEGATTVATLTLSSAPAGSPFVDWISDGSGGTDIFLSTAFICYLAGTHIRTPGGEVAVEDLAIGERVMTVSGEARPVRWVGRLTASRRFADPLRVLPIRIEAGALDENVPSRDLLISPDHAVLIDGILVHAGALVNGVSIRREPNVPMTFTYYHVELADHDLILAENAPAETFIDNVDGMGFDNWAERQALPGVVDAPLVEMAYPRAKAHRQVPLAIRARLAERAAMLHGISAAA